uniref:Uncharacterized protein n=1 Tax=Clytia hemisphaerica TaxID=252671 RepID=A0A7M5VG74_9CNID
MEKYLEKCKQGIEMGQDTFTAVLREMELRQSEPTVVEDGLLLSVLDIVKDLCESSHCPPDFRSCFGSLHLDELKSTLQLESLKLGQLEFDERNPNDVYTVASHYFGIIITVIPTVLSLPMFPIVPDKCFIGEPQFVVFLASENKFARLLKCYEKVQ